MIDTMLVAGVATPLIGALGLAIRRSDRRQECARLRDELVDAARNGELDITDWRVFGLIDWFDQVATTGRTGIPGRHAPDRPDPGDSLAASLATTLRPLGSSLVPPWWPGPTAEGELSDVRSVALAYRERHQSRMRAWPRRPPAPPRRIDVTGRRRPDDALVLMTGSLDLRDSTRGAGSGEGDGEGDQIQLSLAEEIFAFAGSRS